MPNGFEDTQEAQLHRTLHITAPGVAADLREWWLAPKSGEAKTPNFDIASTCAISGKDGLLLVEAKAHDAELHKETTGRILHSVDHTKVGIPRRSRQGIDAAAERARAASHEKIGQAIAAAATGLSGATGIRSKISRDFCYQMSNRFAWSWKLAMSGIPVVLVYLGFLNAREMMDRGRPFATANEWESLVRAHSAALFDGDIWNKVWNVGGQSFAPLIRIAEVPLPT